VPPAEPPVPREVKGLALVSLGNDFASEMIYPLLPAFVTSTLGGGPVALGALDGAADLASAALRWWSGPRADRPGWRGRLIAAGYGIAVLVRPVIAVAGAAWQVIGIRIVDRIGKGLRSPARDAMIADLTPAPVRGRAFGLQRAADHLGAVLGSLTAFAVLELGLPLRAVLGASLVPGLVALAVLGLVLARAGPASGRAEPPAPPAPAVQSGTPDRRLVALALFAAVRLPETLVILRFQELGFSLAAIPLLWAGLHVVRSASSYPAGVAVDRLGGTGVMVAGTLTYALALGLMAQTLGRAADLAVIFGFGLAAGILEPAERASVAAVRSTRRGRLFGSYQGLAGLGALVLGLLYGAIYQRWGPPSALGSAALATAVALALWLGLDWTTRLRS
jgi:MFS family permease